MRKKILNIILAIFLSSTIVSAQTAEVSVALNEQFFDALLDAIFKNFNPPEFPLASVDKNFQNNQPELAQRSAENSYALRQTSFRENNKFQNALLNERNADSIPLICNETIRLQREINGVRTAVRFRDGKLYAPIAFSGSYNPPLIGCVEFQGFAETTIDLEFNRQSQKLLGRVRVQSVNLGGVSNLASGVLSRLVQNSIDKKINPVEILHTDKLSFLVPLQNAGGSLRMRTVGVRHEITNGVLQIHVAYEFAKSN